jgi:hypothetical protein
MAEERHGIVAIDRGEHLQELCQRIPVVKVVEKGLR